MVTPGMEISSWCRLTDEQFRVHQRLDSLGVQFVLNRGSYLNACGVPSSMEVNVCAAVQNGRAVGVTVTTRPSNPGIASCIARQVRGISFPSHPRLDVARTTFSAN